jgi:hypothetical protein
MSPVPVTKMTGRCEPLVVVNTSCVSKPSRHTDIKYDTSRNFVIMILQEYMRRGIRLDVITSGSQQTRQRLENTGVIVNQMDRKH